MQRTRSLMLETLHDKRLRVRSIFPANERQNCKKARAWAFSETGSGAWTGNMTVEYKDLDTRSVGGCGPRVTNDELTLSQLPQEHSAQLPGSRHPWTSKS